ncbi:MAG: response regulator [Endomicrobiales bacterium]|nr:response regulator [Endomicrobiales bacterium]
MNEKKILFVSDNSRSISDWRAVFSGSGIVFDVALSGKEAVERAESGRPGLIVFDKIETSSELFVGQLKQNPKTSSLRVLVLNQGEAKEPAKIKERILLMMVSKKVLIAEDDRQMAGVLESLLMSSGYEVKATYDGVETLKVIKSWQPHLLVLDIMLPIIDGFHVCQTMNEDPSFEVKPRVLIISGRGSDWDQNLGAACGAEHYIVKPFNNEFFLKKVQEIIAFVQ